MFSNLDACFYERGVNFQPLQGAEKGSRSLDIRENLFDFSGQGHLYTDRDRSDKLILNPGTGEIIVR